MSLTPEERKRIYEEEKARLEAEKLTPEQRRKIYDEEEARLEAERLSYSLPTPEPEKRKPSNRFLSGILYLLIGAVVFVILGAIFGSRSPSSQPPTESTSQPSQPPQNAEPPTSNGASQPSQTPSPSPSTPLADFDATALKELEAKAHDAIGTYSALRSEAANLVEDPRVEEGGLVLAEFVDNEVGPWYTRERDFQKSVTGDVPTIPDLMQYGGGPNSGRAQYLVVHVFATLATADHLLWSAVAETMTRCSPERGRVYLKATDHVFNEAELALKRPLTVAETDHFTNLMEQDEGRINNLPGEAQCPQ